MPGSVAGTEMLGYRLSDAVGRLPDRQEVSGDRSIASASHLHGFFTDSSLRAATLPHGSLGRPRRCDLDPESTVA